MSDRQKEAAGTNTSARRTRGNINEKTHTLDCQQYAENPGCPKGCHEP